MAPAGIRMALVEGEDGDGLIVEEDSFRVGTGDSATDAAPNRVISAILGTREGLDDAGLRLSSIGVTWTDKVQAAALRDALATYKIENVMLVSAFLAAAALGQAVGGSIGYQRTAVLFIEPETATLAIVNTADGSVCDVRRQVLADDDDTAVAEIVTLVSAAESMETRPDGVYVVGSDVDVALIKPALEAATSLMVTVPEEQEMALARGAALASGHAPLFVSSTAALAYAQDSGTGAVELDPLPDYPRVPDVKGDDDRAYSAVPDDVADAETVVAGAVEPDGQRRFVLLVGSGLAVVAIAAVVALEIALAIGIRPTVALQPSPSQNHLVAPPQPALVPSEVAAPALPKVNLPAPSGPRAVIPHVPAPLPAAPVAPAPAAPPVPEPLVVVPPVAPILVPPVQAPIPDQLLRPPVPQAPVRVTPPQLQVPQPRAQVPVPQPRIEAPVPRAPMRETPPGLGPMPRWGGGYGGGIPGIPGGGVPGVPGGGEGPFGGGPFGGGGHGGPFGGAHGPFGGGGGPFGGGGHGPFGGGGGGFGGGHGGGFGGGHGGGFGGGHGGHR